MTLDEDLLITDPASHGHATPTDTTNQTASHTLPARVCLIRYVHRHRVRSSPILRCRSHTRITSGHRIAPAEYSGEGFAIRASDVHCRGQAWLIPRGPVKCSGKVRGLLHARRGRAVPRRCGDVNGRGAPGHVATRWRGPKERKGRVSQF